MKVENSKKIKKADLGITIVLLVGILLVVNFFSYQMFFKWDLTENDIFSISTATKKTLKDLDDIVVIKAYFSDNLPGYIMSIRQSVKDILDEYQSYSDGRVRVEYIDPGDDEELQQELYMIGIPQLTFDVLEKDKRELVNGYLGLSIGYGGNIEAIPAVKQDTSDLEYQLTTAIKKVTSDQAATLGFLSSNGTAVLAEQMKAANDELSGLYNIRQVDLSGEEPAIQGNIDTLVAVGPSEELSEQAVAAVREYLDQGGSLVLLDDGVKIGEGLNASRNNSGFNQILKDYGIKINNDLVGDTQSGIASFTQGFFRFSSNYAFWPKITANRFNQENPVVKDLEEAVLPWASSIDVESAQIESGQAVVLAKTTPQGWSVADNYNVVPGEANSPQGQQREINLAVMSGQTGEDENGSGAKLIVVGDSDFVMDNFIGGHPDNLTMFQNMIDILSLDEDLIQVRSKVVSSRPIKDLSDAQRTAMRYFNIFGMTVFVVAYGMGRYYMRRRSRFADDL